MLSHRKKPRPLLPRQFETCLKLSHRLQSRLLTNDSCVENTDDPWPTPTTLPRCHEHSVEFYDGGQVAVPCSGTGWTIDRTGDYIWLDRMPSGGVLLQSSYVRRCFRTLGELRPGNEWRACMCSFGGQAFDILCRWHVQIKSLFCL